MRIDTVEFSKKFDKAFARLTPGEQKRVRAALTKALADFNDPALRRHELKGAREGTISLDAGGDLRLLCRIYRRDNQAIALLLVVGTHSQLYG